jgi:hypothetical protein
MIRVGVKILKEEGNIKVNRCFGTPYWCTHLCPWSSLCKWSMPALAAGKQGRMCRWLIGRFLCSGNVTSIGQIGSSSQSHQVSDWQDGCLTNTSSLNLVPTPLHYNLLPELCVCIAMSCYADATEHRLMAGFSLCSKRKIMGMSSVPCVQ